MVVGKRRFHIDCANTKLLIDEIKNLYVDKVDKDVQLMILVGVINQMVFTKQIDPKFICFALKDLTDRKVPIKSPYYLHYIPKNKRLLAKWRNSQKQK